MKNGHRPGYKIEQIGPLRLYYCPRHPDVKYTKLDDYDLHYELEHGPRGVWGRMYSKERMSE